MFRLVDYPLLVFAFSFAGMYLAGRLGLFLSKWHRNSDSEVREAFGVIQAATLTLLGLLIGFSFSMAVSRYDQRKNYEEAEANAIGTEYVRADLLPPMEAAELRMLLGDYLEQRILYYEVTESAKLRQINERKKQLQSALWSTVVANAEARPTPIAALTVSGMNDVLNSEGYTQAAWWNRIPRAAWWLIGAVAVCCNVLVGYGARHLNTEPVLLVILPVVVSVAFMLIADIDSPRGGIIRVSPQNLEALMPSVRQH